MKPLGNDTIVAQGVLIRCRCLLCLLAADGMDGNYVRFGVVKCSLLGRRSRPLDRSAWSGFYRCLCGSRAEWVKAKDLERRRQTVKRSAELRDYGCNSPCIFLTGRLHFLYLWPSADSHPPCSLEPLTRLHSCRRQHVEPLR